MKRATKCILLCLLSAIVGPLPCSASEEIAPEDCLAIVLSTTPTSGRPGVGFLIGDGTLVVTAYHVVAEASEVGDHRMLGAIKVVSPYLGECSYTEIVAVSEQEDLIVLKVPWAGHPAFELASNRELFDAANLEALGIVPIVSAIPSESMLPFPPTFIAERNVLEVDFVAIRRNEPRFISLAGRGQLGPGWSGAPMIIPGTLKAAGCFVRLNRSASDGRMSSRGPALAHIKRLVRRNTSLRTAETTLEKASDGYQVTRLLLEAHKLLVRDEYEAAAEKANTLLMLRPESPIFHVLAAQIQEAKGNRERAGAHYDTALKFDSRTAMLQMMHGQFLLDDDADQGLDILEGLWEHGRMRPWLVLIMWNVLSERPIEEDCLERLQEALEVEPKNAYLWFNLGAGQIQAGRKDEGFAAMTRAVDLYPERGPLRGNLARLLESEERLDEAELHFRTLLSIEPENPVVYFWLARFLAGHRPVARAEAMEIAQKALALQPGSKLPRREIEKLIGRIQSLPSERSDSANPAAPEER